MGFRFQKRLKIVPGITVNLSKSGVSTSVGGTGARMTFGNGKTRTTVGLPGTGLSYTSVESDKVEVNSTPVQQELTSQQESTGFWGAVGNIARACYPVVKAILGVGIFIFVVLLGGIVAAILAGPTKRKGKREPD